MRRTTDARSLVAVSQALVAVHDWTFLFGRSVAVMFGGMEEWSVPALLCTLPIAAWEFGLGCWLVAKGFRREPEIAA